MNESWNKLIGSVALICKNEKDMCVFLIIWRGRHEWCRWIHKLKCKYSDWRTATYDCLNMYIWVNLICGIELSMIEQ